MWLSDNDARPSRDSGGRGGVRRHLSFGFEPVGHFRRAGWKLGAWHDVRWWQLDLVAAEDEVDPPPEVAVSPSVQ